MLSTREINDRLSQLYQHQQELWRLKNKTQPDALTQKKDIENKLVNNSKSIHYYESLQKKYASAPSMQSHHHHQHQRNLSGNDDEDLVAGMDLSDIPEDASASLQRPSRPQHQQQQQQNRRSLELKSPLSANELNARNRLSVDTRGRQQQLNNNRMSMGTSRLHQLMNMNVWNNPNENSHYSNYANSAMAKSALSINSNEQQPKQQPSSQQSQLSSNQRHETPVQQQKPQQQQSASVKDTQPQKTPIITVNSQHNDMNRTPLNNKNPANIPFSSNQPNRNDDDDIASYSEIADDDVIADHDLQDLDDLIEDDISAYESSPDIDVAFTLLPENPVYLSREQSNKFDALVGKDKTETQIKNLLEDMQERENEIKLTEADKMMDKWEQQQEEEDEDVDMEDPDIEDEYETEESDDKLEKEMAQSDATSVAVEEELEDLMKQVEYEKRKQELLQSDQLLLDTPAMKEEYAYLEKELHTNIKKKQMLEIFFYKIMKAEKDRRKMERSNLRFIDDPDPLIQEKKVKQDGKVIREYQSGKRVIINLPSRSVKVFLPNGHIITRYKNGDMKRIVPRKYIEHYNRNQQSCSVIHADHSRTFFSFSLLQAEKRFTEQQSDQTGVEKIVLLRANQRLLVRIDGSREMVLRNGRKQIVKPQQQKQIIKY